VRLDRIVQDGRARALARRASGRCIPGSVLARRSPSRTCARIWKSRTIRSTMALDPRQSLRVLQDRTVRPLRASVPPRRNANSIFGDWSAVSGPRARFENPVASHSLKLCHLIIACLPGVRPTGNQGADHTTTLSSIVFPELFATCQHLRRFQNCRFDLRRNLESLDALRAMASTIRFDQRAR